MPQCERWQAATVRAPGWRLLPAALRAGVVVTAELRAAQLYGFFRTLTGLGPRHVVLELMLKPGGRLKDLFLRLCFRRTEVVFVSSRAEKARYAERLRLPESRFHFLPFHTNLAEPERCSLDEGYVFAGGRSGRDFATLSEAVRGGPLPAVVVAPAGAIALEAPSRSFHDVPYARYLELLRRARVVVVPLVPSERSTGQVVILEAMALGKPVIATAVTGTADYVEDGVNGLLVPPLDPRALRAAIERLAGDPGLRERLAAAAFARVQRDHTFSVYVERILAACKA